MKQTRVGALLACLFLSAALLAGTALAVVDPTPEFYVADYAGVLNPDTEEHIIARNGLLREATGGEIVVVAVDFMDGMSGDEYAMAVAENWGGIGDGERNNGFLLVFATGENKVYAMPGYGLQRELTASKIEGYLEDTFYDGYDAGEYDSATRDFFDAICGWYEDYYGVSLSGQAAGGGVPMQPQSPAELPVEQPVRRGPGVLFWVGLMVILIGIIVLCDNRRYWRYRRRYMMPGMPPPPYVYRPFLFGWGMGRPRRPPPPPPPRGPRPPFGGGFGGGPRPPAGGGRPSGGARPSSRPPGGGGGSFRGGGAGRRGSSGGPGSFGGGLGGLGGGFGGSRGGFGGGGGFRGGGGGGFRGGGAGRR